MLKKITVSIVAIGILLGFTSGAGAVIKTLDDIYSKLEDIETIVNSISGDTTDLTTYTDQLEAKIDSLPQPATAITIKTVEIAAVDTEYSITLPDNTKGFTFHTRGGDAFRWSPVPGKVAAPTEPYFTVPSNGTMDSSEVPNADFDGTTLYFAAPTSGDTVELIAYY